MIKLLIILIIIPLIYLIFLGIQTSKNELSIESKMKNDYDFLLNKVEKKFLVIDYLIKLIKSDNKNIDQFNMKNILLSYGEKRNIDTILTIEYPLNYLPEGKISYPKVGINMKKGLNEEKFYLDLNTEKEIIIWEGYKIIIFNAASLSPIQLNIEKIDDIKY